MSCDVLTVSRLGITSPASTGNGLIGVLPAELSLLSGLKHFLAPENLLQGSLDVAFGGLTTLETLVLPANRLSGTLPNGILEMNPNLGVLAIGSNAFYGTIASSLINATSLTSLRLSDNSISGFIPTGIGSLSLLGTFLGCE